MSNWDEIKRLAADFQAAQLGSVSQKLTERNCIELVQQLQAQGLLQVHYTLDAKTYLTPEEVRKEILEELEVRGGRVNLVTLQQALNVDYTVVETRVHELLKPATSLDTSGGSLRLINGELLDTGYMRHLAAQIRDALLSTGHLTVGDLVQRFELPTAFLLDVINSHRGTILQARLEGDTLFTEDFVARQRAILRGYLSATTRTVNLNTVLTHCPMPEKLFNNLLEDLVTQQQTDKSTQNPVRGSLNSNKTVFTPDIFYDAQCHWAQSFFQQNRFLTFEDMRRQGIANPLQFCQKNLPDAQVLGTSVVHSSYAQELSAYVEECVRSAAWIDLAAHLPSSLSSQDTAQLTKPLLKPFLGKVSVICNDTVVISEAFLSAFKQKLQPLLAERAERVAHENPKLVVALQGAGKAKKPVVEDEDTGKSENHKGGREGKNKGRSGGGAGTRGVREVKTKAVKNKYMANKKGGDLHEIDHYSADALDGSNESSPPVVFMESEEFIENLRQHFGTEASDEMLEELDEELRPMFQREFITRLQSVFLQTTGPGKNRATLTESQEKIGNMLCGIQLMEKGVEALNATDAELKTGLRKHLVRSDCTDLVALLLGLLVREYSVEWDLEQKPLNTTTHEQRLKLIQQFPEDIGKAAQLVNSCLKKESESLQDFYVSVNELVAKLGLHLQRLGDKKREKVQCQEIAAQLMELLNTQNSSLDALRDTQDASGLEPGQALLVTVRLLCQGQTALPVNAPGRLVPKLIAWLQPHLTPDQYNTLRDFERLVIDYSKSTSSTEKGGSLTTECHSRMLQLYPQLLDLAKLWKKMPLVTSSSGAE